MNQTQKQSKSKRVLIIQKLGLQKFFIDNFVFRPPTIGYTIEFDEQLQKLVLYVIYQKQKLQLDNRLLDVKPFILCKSKFLYVPLAYISHKKISESKQEINSEDNKLLEEFLTEQQQRSKLLVIYSHGNACDLGDVYFFAEKFSTLYSVNFLIYDYTGYGIGKGKYQISEQSIYDDLQSVLAYAVNELKYSLNQIVLIGFSMGSGPTIEIATRYQNLGGVILLAPLASLILCVDYKRDSVNWNEQDLFQNINKIHAVNCPILIVHGSSDTVIDVRHSRLLYEKYQSQCKAQDKRIQYMEILNINHSDVHELLFNEQCEVGQRTYFFLAEIYKKYTQNISLDALKQEEVERCYKLLSLIMEEIQFSDNSIDIASNSSQFGSNYQCVKATITPLEEMSMILQSRKMSSLTQSLWPEFQNFSKTIIYPNFVEQLNKKVEEESKKNGDVDTISEGKNLEKKEPKEQLLCVCSYYEY